jgi:hypothetical protein
VLRRGKTKEQRCAVGDYTAALKNRFLLNSFVGLFALHKAGTQDAIYLPQA